jgi:hypothetical protein
MRGADEGKDQQPQLEKLAGRRAAKLSYAGL